MQAGTSSVVQGKIISSIYKTLNEVFPVVRVYEASIPSLDLPWSFCIAFDNLDPKALSPGEVEHCLQERRLSKLQAYDAETHQGMFLITKALRTTLNDQGRIIVDEKPVYTPLSN